MTDGRTDRRTDGRTHDDSIYRASIASRGKNVKKTLFYVYGIRCDEVSSDDLVTNLLQTLALKGVLKTISIWRSYGQE